MTAPLLELRDLRVDLARTGRRGAARSIVAGVDLTVARGEVVGLVGESGSGKSMTLRAILRLLPRGARIGGELRFEGESVPALRGSALRAYRSHGVSMIHQDPRAATNPVRTIGDFLVEGARRGGDADRASIGARAEALLREVGIPDPERRMRQYPHELSGGLLQRVMIVMALLPNPSLILADEPTTALDVTVQSEVMAILMEQVRSRGLGLVFVTHDLDLAAAVTDSISVMYAGRVVESGSSDAVSAHPAHPYTAGLLASRPRLDRVERLTAIPGRPIAAFEAGPGCPFAPRCGFATEECRTVPPELRELRVLRKPGGLGGEQVACHHAETLRGSRSIGATA